MENLDLRENRVHGDLMFPVGYYRMDLQKGGILLDCHWHRELELFQAEKGEFLFRIGSQPYPVREGDILFVNSGELHSAESTDCREVAYRAVVFSPELLEGPEQDRIFLSYLSPLLKGKISVPRCFHRNGKDAEIAGCFERAYALLNEKPRAYEIRVKSELYRLFACLIERGTGSSEWLADDSSGDAEIVKSGLLFLHQHYSDPVTVKMLADHCHISEGHFSRLFRRYTTASPIRYLNRLRLTRAAELLETTDRKIMEIALDCGFNSLSYFINAFRSEMGCSPSGYRKRMQDSYH